MEPLKCRQGPELNLNVPSLSAFKLSRQRREVASYFAEAYHVQSFRIDFERKDFSSCSKLMDKALRPNIYQDIGEIFFIGIKGYMPFR